MIILGIDTSCDDTCVALLEIRNWKLEILSNIVSSQVKLHAKYGGVYPFLAKREHQRNLAPVLKKVLREARLLKSPKESLRLPTGQAKIKNLSRTEPKVLVRGQKSKIDIIGVTVGPGLEPCLWQGVNFAKDLAQKFKLPIIPINHIEAHILANFISPKYSILNTKYLFPAVCLVVSGGHTQLILMKGIGRHPPTAQYKLIGETRDDAAGECFDKVARILGLGYPGGPIVAAEAAKFSGEPFSVKLPRPMIYQKNYDFSFSGLKTAVLYDFRTQPPEIKTSKKYIQEMCSETQQAIIDVLIYKTLKAAKNFKAKSVILGGGVAANEELRKQFKDKIQKEIPDTKYLIPDTKFCTDNAAMVAITAYFHQKEAKKNWQKIEANANLKIVCL